MLARCWALSTRAARSLRLSWETARPTAVSTYARARSRVGVVSTSASAQASSSRPTWPGSCCTATRPMPWARQLSGTVVTVSEGPASVMPTRSSTGSAGPVVRSDPVGCGRVGQVGNAHHEHGLGSRDLTEQRQGRGGHQARLAHPGQHPGETEELPRVGRRFHATAFWRCGVRVRTLRLWLVGCDAKAGLGPRAAIRKSGPPAPHMTARSVDGCQMRLFRPDVRCGTGRCHSPGPGCVTCRSRHDVRPAV